MTRAFGAKLLRDLRDKVSARQEDVARAGRRAGLPWSAATVAAIEARRRDLTIDELLALGNVLSVLSGKPCRLVVDVDSNDATVRAGTVHEVEVQAPGSFVVRQDLGVRWRDAREGIEHNVRALRVWPDAKRADLEAAHVAAGGEAERKAATRFKVDALAVALAARKLWRRSLSEERDSRVSEGATGRAQQTRRGHVTRELLAELEPHVKAARRARR